MRILFVVENYLPHLGGAEVMFQNICEGLAANGHTVTVLTHRIPGTSAKERIGGVDVVRVRCFDSRYLFTFFAIPKAIRLAGSHDVISTTTPNGAPPAWVAARVRGKPVVISVLETWIGKWRTFTSFGPVRAAIHDILERLVYAPRYDAYACISAATKARLEESVPKARKRAHKILIGFDPAPWSKRQPAQAKALRKALGLDGKFVILASGRPGASKGFEYLIPAFKKVRQRIPNAVLVLMLSKDTQYRHKVEEFRLDAGPGVLFLDTKPYKELPVYRQMADCVVVPSLSEGFGYAVLEAVACGTPVVASDVASIPEVVYGKHVLVKPADADALAKGIVAVHDRKWKTLAAKKFPWSRTIREYEALYRKVAER